MAHSTFKTLFYINRSKQKKNGRCPIMGRITINGQQVQYSMGLDVNPNNWDAKHGRCKGDTDEMKNINRILTEKEGQIQTKYNELVWQKGYVSAELLKNCLTEDSQSNGMLMEEADRFIEEKRPCVGISIAQSTFRNYIYDKQLIVSFLLERYGMSDIGYSRLDYGFVEELDFYLKSKRRLSPATIQMTVIFLRKLISIGQQKKYIRRDPFVDFKAEKPRGTRRYLTTEELKRILQTPILNKQFERARQLFIFCAFTGLARVDMLRLTPKHIHHYDDGTCEIRIKRQKTDVEAIIPLLPIAKEILDIHIKGKQHDDLIFPTLNVSKASFACINIGQICQIEKGLTFHMARHTFATTICLSNGIAMETLCKMLGHSDIGTTQIYGKITDLKIREDMNRLQEHKSKAFSDYTEAIEKQNTTIF